MKTWPLLYFVAISLPVAGQGGGNGADFELSIHPTYASNAYTTALLGMRMRIIL